MLAKGQTIIQLFEEWSPKHIAAMPDDKIGLQLGSLQKDITGVLTALDVTEAVADEAIRIGANLIIAHHAIIFRPLSNLQTDTPAGRLFEKLIKNDIAVYIAHTNLDVAEGGVNDMLVGALGLTVTGHLEDVHTEKLKKLVVFVPESHHEALLQALFHAGAGAIGNYSHCSFNIAGTGTFLPGDGTEPFVGEPGKLERVPEVRVETVVPESAERRVVQAMLKAHPYEEVAYDLYPMDLKGRTVGIGRIGKLKESTTLERFVAQAKSALNVPAVRVVGDLQRQVYKVAVLGGSGGRYVRSAQFAGADVLVTGDIDYHTAHDALAAGMAIVDAGHNIEKVMKQGVADVLRGKLKERGYTTPVTPSAVNTEVFQFI